MYKINGLRVLWRRLALTGGHSRPTLNQRVVGLNPTASHQNFSDLRLPTGRTGGQGGFPQVKVPMNQSLSALMRVAAVAALLSLTACNGLYFGDSPGPDVRKERGPLTVPPPPAADRPAR